MNVVRAIWDALYSLLVDDGFLAIAALAAIGAVWVLTNDVLVGTTNLVGWLLCGLLALSVILSARRAVIASRRE